ncbi:MAG: hypothetical protein ACI9M1_001424 [Porticoccaceae bacterium]|jgi:hypothetical protein
MKKKFSILNLVLTIAVLFSMLTQSVHSYEHVLKEFSEKKCYHKLTSGTEITHQHNKFHSCYLCNFSISSFLSTDAYSSELSNLILKSGSSLAISKETTPFFKGSLFALRGPPLV